MVIVAEPREPIRNNNLLYNLELKTSHGTFSTNATNNSKLIAIKANSTYHIPQPPTQEAIPQLQQHEQSFPSLIHHKGNAERTILPFPRAQVSRIQIPETPNAFVHNRVPAILSARLLPGSPPSLPGFFYQESTSGIFTIWREREREKGRGRDRTGASKTEKQRESSSREPLK